MCKGAYDYERHSWRGVCPYGDVCSGCDARGYCTRMEDREARRLRADGSPDGPEVASVLEVRRG